MILYCAISHKELETIFDSGMRYFPKVSRKFYFHGSSNTLRAQLIKGAGKKSQYVARISFHQKFAGIIDKRHENARNSFTVEANQIEELNSEIFGSIEILEGHFHSGFSGTISMTQYFSRCNCADEILTLLMKTFEYNSMDFYLSVKTNLKLIFCNYAYWKSLPESSFPSAIHPIKHVLDSIAQLIHESYPSITLPTYPVILTSEIED